MTSKMRKTMILVRRFSSARRPRQWRRSLCKKPLWFMVDRFEDVGGWSRGVGTDVDVSKLMPFAIIHRQCRYKDGSTFGGCAGDAPFWWLPRGWTQGGPSVAWPRRTRYLTPYAKLDKNTQFGTTTRTFGRLQAQKAPYPSVSACGCPELRMAVRNCAQLSGTARSCPELRAAV